MGFYPPRIIVSQMRITIASSRTIVPIAPPFMSFFISSHEVYHIIFLSAVQKGLTRLDRAPKGRTLFVAGGEERAPGIPGFPGLTT